MSFKTQLMMIIALLQQPQITSVVIPEPISDDPPPNPFAPPKKYKDEYFANPFESRYDDRRPKSTYVRDENKYKFNSEELEQYRSLDKKQRKQFLKDRGLK